MSLLASRKNVKLSALLSLSHVPIAFRAFSFITSVLSVVERTCSDFRFLGL